MTVKEYKRRLRDNLRVARRNLEISQNVAGERIGKAKSTFENKINLKSGKFSFYEVLNICKFLNIKLADLLAMTEIIQRMEGGENEKFKKLRTGS